MTWNEQILRGDGNQEPGCGVDQLPGAEDVVTDRVPAMGYHTTQPP